MSSVSHNPLLKMKSRAAAVSVSRGSGIAGAVGRRGFGRKLNKKEKEKTTMNLGSRLGHISNPYWAQWAWFFLRPIYNLLD